MEPIWNAEVELIRALQRIDWLQLPMLLVTELGSETFFLLLLPLLYWCVNPWVGVRVGLMLLLSSSVNHALKIAGAMPRPYWYSADVAAYVAEESFGLPSGHAQNAVAVWGALAAQLQRGWAWGAAFTLMLLSGVSRVYLGVHFISDVLAGWLVGALLLWAFVAWTEPVTIRASLWRRRQQIVAVTITALALLVPSVLALLALGAWHIPALWLENAALAHPDELPDPLSLNTAFTTAGTWFGFAIGALWLSLRARLSAAGALWKRVARYVVGMIGVVVLYAGLGALLPDDGTALALALRFGRYALIGAWIAAGAPLVFRHLGLLDRQPATRTTPATIDRAQA